MAGWAHRDEVFQLVGLDIGSETAVGNLVMYVELTAEILLADAAFPTGEAVAFARLARLNLPIAPPPFRRLSQTDLKRGLCRSPSLAAVAAAKVQLRLGSIPGWHRNSLTAMSTAGLDPFPIGSTRIVDKVKTHLVTGGGHSQALYLKGQGNERSEV